jgi:hypothetical protein
MKNKILVTLTVFLFSFSVSQGQQEYWVGTSSVSIEPDSTLFSVALSGYGYPAEGRFSINWILRGDAPVGIAAITGLDGKFFAADRNNTLWSGTPSGENISWKKIGIADGIRALAGMNGRLYAVSDKGELLVRKAIQQKAKWKIMGDAADIKTLTALGENLYATNNKDQVLKMDFLQRDKRWEPIGQAKDVRSMTSNGERLFAIDGGDSLWHIQPHQKAVPWAQIGRNNGITFAIHIRQIVVLNSRLYAVSTDNKLYFARHSTDGISPGLIIHLQMRLKTSFPKKGIFRNRRF